MRFYHGAPEGWRVNEEVMTTQRTPLVTVEMATELSANDISEICDATEEAIEAGGGFGWLAPPPALCAGRLLARRVIGTRLSPVSRQA